ncbi:MAG: FtsH protease activity modulator HflK [Chloroflexi bacterium]|nr:FtsH protease activity modulator HflK [Chloroflexota bacterium]
MEYPQPPEGPPSGPQTPPIQWNIDRAKALRWGIRSGIAVALLLAAWWGFSSFYAVQPGEFGVALTFGRHSGLTGPGLHYHLPWPVQSVVKVDVGKVRRGEGSALMLASDEKLVAVQLAVQYVVEDPARYLFRVRAPEQVAFTTASIALRTVVGRHPSDFIMGDGRDTVQSEFKTLVQELMDSYESGLRATDVQLLAVEHPQEVRAAIEDVVRAEEDRSRLIKEAEANLERVIPEARGEAAKMIVEAEAYRERTASEARSLAAKMIVEAEAYRERTAPEARSQAARMVMEAEAYREQRLLTAKGDADRFLLLLEEYDKAPEVTRERLYTEAVQRSLRDADIFVLDMGEGGVSPLLPLAPLFSMPAPTPTPTPTPSGR